MRMSTGSEVPRKRCGTPGPAFVRTSRVPQARAEPAVLGRDPNRRAERVDPDEALPRRHARERARAEPLRNVEVTAGTTGSGRRGRPCRPVGTVSNQAFCCHATSGASAARKHAEPRVHAGGRERREAAPRPEEAVVPGARVAQVPDRVEADRPHREPVVRGRRGQASGPGESVAIGAEVGGLRSAAAEEVGRERGGAGELGGAEEVGGRPEPLEQKLAAWLARRLD